MTRCVVFDFDGTLVDSNEVKRVAFYEVVAAHPEGKRHMAAALGTVEGDRSAVFQDYALRQAELGEIMDPVALAATYTRTVDSRVAAAPEMLGAIALLRDLRRRGLTVHLFSATPERSLGWILESRGWTDFFDSVHGSPQPKSDSLGEISRGEERRPDQIAVVGDGVDDECAAASVGCLFIPVGDGSYARANPGTQTCALSDVPSRLASVSRECAPQ